jgi:hypothetical protein
MEEVIDVDAIKRGWSSSTCTVEIALPAGGALKWVAIAVP